jgi:polysaccharide deacetylase family protein (PEP-CTERM system associated)
MKHTARTDPTFLFSIDLEDVRSLIPDGERFAERVPANVERYLEFLSQHDARCTFFTVGDIARRYPSLMREIVAEGHEIACHSRDHTPLDRHNRESFREDLQQCLEDFSRVGAERISGYRAPIASMTQETTWAYEILRELGFTYSASVLAARNPLYGWPSFGPDRARMVDGVWELPVSLSGLPGLNVPLVGGVYFRVLPLPLVEYLFRRRLSSGHPVIGYLHPHDIDTEQERFMHGEINENRFYNWLLYRNRGDVFRRLERLLQHGVAIVPFREYVERNLEPADGHD